MSKQLFLIELRKNVVALYPWAFDVARVDKMIDLAGRMLEGEGNLIQIDGPAVVKAWQAVGGKGKPSYKALRALPSVLKVHDGDLKGMVERPAAHIRHAGLIIDASFNKAGGVDYYVVERGPGRFYSLAAAKEIAEARATRMGTK